MAGKNLPYVIQCFTVREGIKKSTDLVTPNIEAGTDKFEAGTDGTNDGGMYKEGTRDGDQQHVSRGALGRGQAPCRHMRGGYCTTHGIRGEKSVRPISVTTMGEDGVQRRKTVRKTIYSCNLGPRGRGGRATQRQLSFAGTTGQGAAVTTNNLGSDFDDFDASKEGQRGGHCVNNGKVADKKD